MANKRNREFWESSTRNGAAFTHYYNRLTELAISMFEWQNLPETVDERYLELGLFSNGMMVFFQDEILGFLGLRCMINGQFNVYRVPVGRRAYADNGYNKPLTDKDSVIIFNNMLRQNCVMDVRMFAEKLADLDRSIIVNARAQKTPVLIQAAENERLTMLNLYKEYDGNAPVIYGDKGLNAKGLTVLKTDSPYTADKLYQLKTEIWNEALTYLGISNVNLVKKERLVTDEVAKNQGGIVASRYSRLQARRQACEEINRMFGLDVWVDYREDFQTYLSGDTVDGETEGGEEDE